MSEDIKNNGVKPDEHLNDQDKIEEMSPENALDKPDVTEPDPDSPLEKAEPVLEEAPEPLLLDDDRKPEDQEEIKTDFKPFYKKEAGFKKLNSFFLYFLLTVLYLGQIALGVQTFLDDAPFKLEVATIIIICLALTGVLWKIVSLEVKAGLAAVGVSGVLTVAWTVYGRQINLPSPLAEYFYPVLLCLALLAMLTAIWKLWPRLHWLPIVLTLPVLYTALAPVWPFAGGGGGLDAIILGPPFMDQWPVFVRSGFLLFQAVLPLGAVLFIILQGRTLLRPQYETHWGFIFWSLSFLLISTVGLSGLERSEKATFPKFDPLIARFYPAAIPAKEIKADALTDESGPTATSLTPDETVASAEPDTAPPTTSESLAPSAPVTGDEEPSGLKPDEPAASSTGPAPEAGEVEPTSPLQAETLTEAPTVEPGIEPRDKTATLTDPELAGRIEKLETEIDELKARIEAQEMLIRSLLDYFGTKQERPQDKPDSAQPPLPGDDFTPPQPDQPADKYFEQDFT